MTVLNAVLLGIIQGITEFLPVSSFGHMAVLQNLWGMEGGTGVLFEAMLHLGTMAAVIMVFWKDVRHVGEELMGMLMDLVGNLNLYIHNRRTGDNLHYARIVHGTYRKFTALILVSCIPTFILGYTARRIVAMAALSPMLPQIGLLITGIFLLVVDLSKAGGQRAPREAHYDHAMWIGISQGIAVFPGFSRSGLTISAAMLCGFDRKFAVKYSYILSIPAILGAFFSQIGKFAAPAMSVGLAFTYLLAAIVAGAVGYFSIRFLLKLVYKVKFRYFAIYCFAAGIYALTRSFL